MTEETEGDLLSIAAVNSSRTAIRSKPTYQWPFVTSSIPKRLWASNNCSESSLCSFRGSKAAKQAYAAAAAASRNSDEEMLPLKCCLMSVSFPWEHIAYDLLFKGGPTVNL